MSTAVIWCVVVPLGVIAWALAVACVLSVAVLFEWLRPCKGKGKP